MLNSKKILYITNNVSGSGGLERVLSIKASYLADVLGYEIHIMTLNQGSASLFYNFSPKIEHHDITVVRNPIQYIRTYRKGIRSVVKRVNPDIICVCDDGIKGFFVPKILGKSRPIIYERHVSKLIADEVWKPSFKKKIITATKYMLMNYGAKSFDAFVVLTNGNLQEWNLKNIKVISNPLSFYPEERAALHNKKIIAVGKQCGQKGYDRLLLSWKEVVKKHPDWSVEIYGASNPDHDFEKLSRELEVDDSVRFCAPVKNIKDKFLESSIHVLASRFEGFGMVIIEAMSCGVPSVSYDCPHGPSDIISHQEDGILVDNGDIESFSRSLIDLIEDKEKRIAMGVAAKENVKRYLSENIVPQWDMLFKSLIED